MKFTNSNNRNNNFSDNSQNEDNNLPLDIVDEDGNIEECQTPHGVHEHAASLYLHNALRDEIEKHQKKYRESKKRRNGPPYVTYTEEELIYIPVIVWLNTAQPGPKTWDDSDVSLMIDYTNEMLAGTWQYDGSSYQDFINNPGDKNNENFPFNNVRAIDDPNHGIDSGIRLKLCPVVPKRLFNPLWQNARFTIRGELSPISYTKYNPYIQSVCMNSIANVTRVHDDEPVSEDSFSMFDLSFQNIYERETICFTKTSVANLEEGREGNFTCGPYGAIIRLDGSDVANVSWDAVDVINRQDAGQPFADGSGVYEVYQDVKSNPQTYVSDTDATGFLNSAIRQRAESIIGVATNYTQTVNSYNSGAFERPWPYQLSHNYLSTNASGSGSPYKIYYAPSSSISHGYAKVNKPRNGIASACYTIPAMHVFMYGEGGSMAQFPAPNESSALLTTGLNGAHWLNTPQLTPGGSSNRIRYAASVLFHELGHSVGAFHAFQGGRTQGSNNKQQFLPFFETRKSWFKNADSFIPPFEYQEGDFDPDQPGEIKDYKDISQEEKVFLEMMLSKVPKDITHNYTRKIIFDPGALGSDFSISHNYPEHLEHAGDFAKDSDDEFKWSYILNRYLGMSVSVDSLWGDSYILLDDNGNNVSEAQGGKPEFVVNPTTDLVNGILQAPISRDPIYNISTLFREDIVTLESLQNSSYDNYTDCYYPELGGWALKQTGSKTTIMYATQLLHTGVSASSFTYGGFHDWRDINNSEIGTTLRIIMLRDTDNVISNTPEHPFPLNDKMNFIYTGQNCRTTGVPGYYDFTYTPNGFDVYGLGIEDSVGSYCSQGFTFTPAEGQPVYGEWYQSQIDSYSVKRILVREVVVPSMNDDTSIAIETIPANRKGPAITSRVPFCVPDEDGNPTDVFDPFWFANINWRDPKNRAYPENWPVSKLYDQFDDNGDPLCPCLYAEQSFYDKGELHTYTPINAARDKFVTGDPSRVNQANEQTGNGYTFNDDAYKLHLILNTSYVRSLAPKTSLGKFSRVGVPIINNASVYTDVDGNIQMDTSDISYPRNTYIRDYYDHTEDADVPFPNFGSGDTFESGRIYFNTVGFGGDSEKNYANDMGFSGEHFNGMQYPHIAGYFFKNHLFGWKPYPGGYESQDPIHYVTIPMGGVGYCGAFPHGSHYIKFRWDYEASVQENNQRTNLDNYMYSGIFASQAMPYSAFNINNQTEDLPTQLYSRSANASSELVRLDYVKRGFGSTDPSSPYYNPYRLNIFKVDDLGSETRRIHTTALMRQFSTLYGNTVIVDGEEQSLLNFADCSPTHGDYNVGILNNTMQYTRGVAAYINAPDVASFGTVVSIYSSDYSAYVYNIDEELLPTYDAITSSTALYTKGEHLQRSTMTPFQIFRMRALMETDKVGVWKKIVEFGQEINIRQNYAESNTLKDHMDYCLNKLQTAGEVTGIGVIPLEPGFFDPDNKESCDDGHCANSTPIPVCTDQELDVCFDVRDEVESQFLPSINETKGPKIACVDINRLYGCYLEKDDSACEYASYTSIASQCDSEGELQTISNCSNHAPTIEFYQNLGITSLYDSNGNQLDFSNFYTSSGQVFSFGEDVGSGVPVYHYNVVDRSKDEYENSSKNFHQILTNLIKIISFAKQ